MTLDQLKRLLSTRGITYFVAPDKPMLLMGFGGLHGSYQVVMNIELDGKFLMIRTLGYGSCPKSHPHCDAVVQVLGALNFLMRTTKFSWDPNDGEIVASLELWLEDAAVTDQQFQALLGAFLPALDIAHHRVSATMETGTDPGMDLPGFPPGAADQPRIPEPASPGGSPKVI
jgi:hypothetical protein